MLYNCDILWTGTVKFEIFPLGIDFELELPTPTMAFIAFYFIKEKY